MKAPTYNTRELPVLRAADRLVLRLYTHRRWCEQEVRPAPGETMRYLVARFQRELRLTVQPAYHRVCLYVAADIQGERMLASVPRDSIPEELHHE